MTSGIMFALQFCGLLLAVGMICLYAHFQKGYVGQRPWLLQLGCALPTASGIFAFMLPFFLY